MKNLVVIIVLVIIIGAAIRYIVKSKKNGVKCIGCPSGACCPSQNKGNCNCECDEEK